MIYNSLSIDKKGLRNFGIIFGLIFFILFGLLLPWLLNYSFQMWPLFFSCLLWVLALVSPIVLRPLYQLWMIFGYALNWANTRIILGIIFYIIMFPIALILRLLKKESAIMPIDKSSHSYKILCKARKKDHIERPY